MATLTLKPEQKIFNDNVLKRQDMSSNDYSIYFEEKPAFVTYYSKNMKKSTVEETLDTAVDLLTPSSKASVKFDKIMDLPLYDLTGVDSVDLEDSDFGLNTEVNGSAIILPHLIKPAEEDFFVINHDLNRHLFMVNDVILDKVSGDKFYKITFNLDHRSEYEVMHQQTSDEYVTDYDNLGTSNKAIIESTDYALVDSLVSDYNNMSSFMEQYLYHSNMNFMFFKDTNNNRVSDPMIQKFIMDNELLLPLRLKDFYNSIYLDEIDIGSDLRRSMYDRLYKNTLFWALENSDYGKLSMLNYTLFSNSKKNELNYEGDIYNITNYNLSFQSDGLYQFFDHQFIINITSGILYADGVHVFEDFIIKYAIGDITKDTIKGELALLEFDDNERGMTEISVVLFVVKTLHNTILKR